MKYLRIVVEDRVAVNGAREGFFRLAYRLRREGAMSPDILTRLNACLDKLDDLLDLPDRFHKGSSKGAKNRETKGLSWFKTDATQAVGLAMELARILETLNVKTAILRSNRIGYVVFEDDVQVVAEPFSDTPT